MITVIKKVSERTTWDAIQKDVDEGKAGEYQIGTIIVETLKDGRQMPYALAAVNHYQQDELIFVNMENYGDHCMNEKDTNEGGWNKSEMRRHANEDILALLPDDMAAVIAPRTIIEIEDDGTKVESTDKLWGLSTMEVSGEWYRDNDNGVDKQLPYFEDRANRMLKDTDVESACGWCERSPNRDYSNYFYHVSINGHPYYIAWPYNSLGVCLGLTIRKSKYERIEKQEEKIMTTAYKKLQDDESAKMLKQHYFVSIAVDGRIDVSVDATSPEEAKALALDAFLDEDLRDLEVVGVKAVNATDENDNITDF